MTDSKKTTGDDKAGDSSKKEALKHRPHDEIKIAEPGPISDDMSFLEEVAIQIDSLQEEDGVDFWEEVSTGAFEETPPGAAAAPTREPAAEKAAGPSLRQQGATIDPGRVRKTGGNPAAGYAAFPRRKLEEAHLRSAAAQTGRGKMKGMQIGFLLMLACLLLVLGAAGGFYLFKAEPPPEPRPLVRFPVPILPVPEQDAPADAVAEETVPAAQASPAAVPQDPVGTSPAAVPPSFPSSSASDFLPTSAAGAKEAAIVDFLLSWQSAWENSAGENGRIDPFIAHYSRRFEADGMDLAAWRVDKAAKNRKKDWIRIGIDDLKIAEAAADGTVKVRFIQTYESSNYADKTEKRLVLAREEGRWKILGRLPVAADQ